MLLFNQVLLLLVKATNWIDNLDAFLEQAFEGWFGFKSVNRKTVRLEGPDDLEERVAPATDLWVGPAGGLWSNGANWSSGGQARVPQNGDILQFGGSVGGVNGALTNSTDDMANLSIASLQINDVNVPGNVFNQTITLNNSLTVTGGVLIANNTGTNATIAGNSSLNVPNKTSTFNWGGGTISVPLNFGQAGMGGGTMTISGSDITVNNTFTNYGTVNWNSQNPQQQAGPNINLNGAGTSIQNKGTFNINTSSTESINGGGTITNNGVMQKSGPNTTTFNVTAFTNAAGGTLTVNRGTLAITDAIFINTNGTIVLNGGNLESNTTIKLNGGGLQGAGTVTGNLDNVGGTVTPGVNGVPGTLSIIGDYTQESGGTLVINIDAMGNLGVLSIQRDPNTLLGGTATLGGTLNVNKNAAYTPPPGTDLVFMRYRSLAQYHDFATVSISNNQWIDPLGSGMEEFVATHTTSTYDLLSQNI